jgi:hypothetical protein
MASSQPIALPPSRREAVGTGRYRTIEAGHGRALTGGWLLHRWVETPVEHWRKHRQALLPVRV